MVRQIKVIADKAPDCSSLKSIVESVTRGCKTNDERAIAIYNFVRMTHYHRDYPREEGGIAAIKLINSYGWSLCGGLHTVQAALWRELGWPWRYIGWSSPAHTTVEARYDGRWHYLDVFLKFYVWKAAADAPGGHTIASQADIRAEPALVTEGLMYDDTRKVCYHTDCPLVSTDGTTNWQAPAFLVCGDDIEGVLKGVNNSRDAGSPTAWNAIKFDEDGYSTDVNLAPGYSLTLTWDAIEGAHWWSGRTEAPYHGCTDKDYRNCPALGPVLEPYAPSGGRRRSFANGKLVFAPELKSDAVLTALASKQNVKLQDGKIVPADSTKPASITVALSSPYVMTQARGRADGADKVEVSVDGGKTFKPVALRDFSQAVAGKYACLVRLTFASALQSLEIQAVVQCNRCALPYLSPGSNTITVSALAPRELGDNRLVVTYAYRPGWRDCSYDQLCKEGSTIGSAQKAQWAPTPTVVQKVFAAKDLPATFQVDVPTPKDKYPVYPRMLFLRREIVAPGGQPLPLPTDATSPKVGPDDVLKTLPNPFLMGARQ
ncbi:MAG TPA: transglutaminase domain-containing protein [Phycisphaerae bacterium]|nr:transglutaminase domain-containing protein [Phycisphaerae bacterium]